MLVLSRKKNTSIKITVNGIEIDVWVTGIKGNTVHLGFEAPEEVSINRFEVWEKIQEGLQSQTSEAVDDHLSSETA